MVCLDTHALLWWTLDPGRLSDAATRACRTMEREQGYVSAISIWELGLRIKQGKLEMGMSIEAFHKKLQRLSFLEIVPVSADLWMQNLQLKWDHRDPADRTIVATALSYRLPLITADETIRDSRLVKIIW